MVALALELQRRGHTPVIATSESYREKIVSTGVAFHATRPNLTPDDKDLLRAVMDERGGPEHVIRRLMVPAVREMYADLMDAAHGADLMVSAELVFAADSVAEKTGIPWIVATLAPLSFMSRYDPPILIQAPWLGRIAAFSKPLYAWLVALSQWGIRHWTEPVRQMRRDLGLLPGPPGCSGRASMRPRFLRCSRRSSAGLSLTGRPTRGRRGSPSTIVTNRCRRRWARFSTPAAESVPFHPVAASWLCWLTRLSPRCCEQLRSNPRTPEPRTRDPATSPSPATRRSAPARDAGPARGGRP